jgi:hypothetical protein
MPIYVNITTSIGEFTCGDGNLLANIINDLKIHKSIGGGRAFLF